MNTDEYIQLLGHLGDPIERLIVLSREELHLALDPYAGIWGDHIEPKRLKNNPTKVAPEWIDFAGSHYTAIVRLYQAYQKFVAINHVLKRIEQGDDSALVLVEMHDVAAGFWEHIGSVIDNLSACWTDAPTLRVRNAKEKEVSPDGSRLDWMYDRRSQFIHSRIVPKGIEAGIPYFNFRLFDNKSTNWNSHYMREELVEQKYPELWKEFLMLIGQEWEKLRSRLRAREEIPTKTLQFPAIDFSQLKPGDIRINGGPTPPSNVLWNFPNIPPSGTR